MKGANVCLAVISTGVLVPFTAHEGTVTSVPWDKILVKDAMEHFNLQYILSATSAARISSHSSSFLGLFLEISQITCSSSLGTR
jgi:hypothetical protein